MNSSSVFRAIFWRQLLMHFIASLLIVLSVQTFFYLHNLFLFEQLSIQWHEKTRNTFSELALKGYGFGDLLMYKFYAVGISIPEAIIILVTILITASKKKGYWIGPLMVCILIIVLFRFSNYRFFHETVLVWLENKFDSAKAIVFVFTGSLEFVIGLLIFLKSNYFR